jgi:hypothetical protein
MTTTESQPQGRAGLRLHDLFGLVFGFSLAATLLRSFRAEFEPFVFLQGLMLLISFVWIGTAMSGPIVILLDRQRTSPRSRSEIAWCLIGIYFIGLTLIVVPYRNQETPWAMLTLVQFVGAAIILGWLLSDRNSQVTPKQIGRSWTTSVSKWLIFTWPLAWLALLFMLWGK